MKDRGCLKSNNYAVSLIEFSAVDNFALAFRFSPSEIKAYSTLSTLF